MEDFLLVAGLFGGGYFLIKKYQENQAQSNDPRIDENQLDVDDVVTMLEEFRPNSGDEMQVQVQLKTFFQKRIRHVQREYGLETKLKIDFDLGKGAVGVEVKMAKSLMAASAYHRMLGQVREYIKKKYDEDNLIIVVVTNKTLSKENTFVEKLEEDMEELGATLVWVKTREKVSAAK